MNMSHLRHKLDFTNQADFVKRDRRVITAIMMLVIALSIGLFRAASPFAGDDTTPIDVVNIVSEEQSIGESFASVDTYSESLSTSVLGAFKHLQSPGSKVASFTFGKKNGKGKYRFANGDVYNGQWKNGKMSGKGTYTFANKARVKGTFKKNKFISGTYRVTNKKGTYIFTIKKRRIKQAKIRLKSGFKYQGDYGMNRLHGNGKATYPSGDTYQGTFKSGKRSGTGTYIWKDGSKYTGRWSNDLMSGSGTYYYPKSSSAERLVGSFANNHPTGTCSYYLKSGKWYRTSWVNGRCTGVS